LVLVWKLLQFLPFCNFFREIVIKGLMTNWGVKESFQTSVSSHFAMYYVCRL
jgi:hypothetical protein